MNPTRMTVGLRSVAAATMMAWVLAGCGGPPSSKPATAGKEAPPAKVTGAPKEADLATVTLSEEAERRLGVETVVAAEKQLPLVRQVAGELMVPPGRTMLLSATAGGTIVAADNQIPQPGVAVRVYGPDLETLRATAADLGARFRDVPGVADLQVEPQVLVPEVQVTLKPQAARRFGLTPGDVRRAATTLVQGTKVGEIYEDQKIFDVAVWGQPQVRADVAALSDIRIDTPGGGHIPLAEVADIYVAPSPNVIQHENASRRIDVSCNVRGRDLGSVARDIEQRVRTASFARGYHAEVLGEYAARRDSQNRLLAFSAIALLGILLVLYSDFQSTRLTALVTVSLPFALVGGVAAAFLSGGVLSLGSLVGFITVLGIAARNGILLVSHYRELERAEGVPFGRALVLQGSEERLAPILMPALYLRFGRRSG